MVFSLPSSLEMEGLNYFSYDMCDSSNPEKESEYINITRPWFHDWIYRDEPWGWNNEAWLRDYMYGPEEGAETMSEFLGAVTDTRKRVT